MKAKKKTTSALWTLWIPVILAFVLVASAWAVIITIARDNPVRPIEIEKYEKPKKPQ